MTGSPFQPKKQDKSSEGGGLKWLVRGGGVCTKFEKGGG